MSSVNHIKQAHSFPSQMFNILRKLITNYLQILLHTNCIPYSVRNMSLSFLSILVKTCETTQLIEPAQAPLQLTGFPLFCTHKIPGFSRILYKIPGIIFFFLMWPPHTIVKCLHFICITSLFCLYYPKVCIPPLTATHNDLYHFERWVLIKKTQKLMI